MNMVVVTYVYVSFLLSLSISTFFLQFVLSFFQSSPILMHGGKLSTEVSLGWDRFHGGAKNSHTNLQYWCWTSSFSVSAREISCVPPGPPSACTPLRRPSWMGHITSQWAYFLSPLLSLYLANVRSLERTWEGAWIGRRLEDLKKVRSVCLCLWPIPGRTQRLAVSY